MGFAEVANGDQFATLAIPSIFLMLAATVALVNGLLDPGRPLCATLPTESGLTVSAAIFFWLFCFWEGRRQGCVGMVSDGKFQPPP
jgi:hypothetical protein